MNIFVKKQSTSFRYFILYWGIFLSIVLLCVFFNINENKQIIDTNIEWTPLKDFWIILGNNSLVFLCLILSISVGRIGVFSVIIVNSIHLGLLISQFMDFSYLLLIIPHGVFEISVLLMLGAVISRYLDDDKKNTKALIKKICLLYIGLLCSAAIEAWITPYLIFLVF